MQNARKFDRFVVLTLVSSFLAVGCGDSNSNDNETLLLGLVLLDQQAKAAEAKKQCTTEVDNDSTFDLNSPKELCKPEAGSGRHFRFEDVGTNQNNGYLNLLIGYGDRNDPVNFPTAQTQFGAFAITTPGDGRWRIFFGKSQSCNQPFIDVRFSGINGGFNAGNGVKENLFTTTSLPTSTPPTTGCVVEPSGIWGPSTICMDITKGAAGSSPRITIWATGIKGADCKKLKTLTAESKLYEKADWTSLVETLDDRNYIYRNLDGISVKRVVVRSETAIQN